mgnify:CR=1 FL=1
MATHPPGITVKIVGIKSDSQGRKCEEHDICGSVIAEDVVVRFRKVQVIVNGVEESAIAAYHVSDGIDRSTGRIMTGCWHKSLRCTHKIQKVLQGKGSFIATKDVVWRQSYRVSTTMLSPSCHKQEPLVTAVMTVMTVPTVPTIRNDRELKIPIPITTLLKQRNRKYNTL